ncbi:MAG: prephenate dehydrogenase [Clostridiaceae bacterium]|nr:prephenate dehydrogenase [Clostridiaceae bacterium]
MALTRTIGIIGLGLIGGSIARALKKSGRTYIVYGCDRQEKVLESALKDKVIDRICQINDLGDCDAIFLCVPVSGMKPILEELIVNIKNNCVLTDVGSTKGDVSRLIDSLGLNGRFIGGHPLAGSEKSGYEASKSNMFENAYYCLTPTSETRSEDLEFLKDIVADMGAIPIIMTPEEHDKATAAISHVPHVVAALLVNMVGELDNQDNIMKNIAAGGFKDITRIASSNPDLWTGICFSNKEMLLNTLSHFSDGLERFKEILLNDQKESVNRFFDSARSLRSSISDKIGLIQKTYDILVDVDDKPGIIAVIATALANENINIKNIGIIHSRETEEGALQIQFENENASKQGVKVLTSLGYRVTEKE